MTYGAAPEEPDHADLTSVSNSVERLVDGAGATNINDMVYSNASGLTHIPSDPILNKKGKERTILSTSLSQSGVSL